MKSFGRFGGVCVLTLLAAGGGETGITAPVPAEVGRLTRDGARLLSEGRYQAAAEVYLGGAGLARGWGDARREGLFLNAAAGAYFAGQQYRDAVGAYRKAVERASEAGEAELAAVAHLNLSSLHTTLWDPDTGEVELIAAERLLPGGSRYRPKLYAMKMYLAALRGDGVEARRWAIEAAAAAGRAGEMGLLAQVLDKQGGLALREGELEEAEEYLTASYRIRRLGKLPHLESSCRALARLRLAQGRVEEAVRLSEAAAEAARHSPAGGTGWWGNYERALVLRAAGRPEEALAEARKAAANAQGWRTLLPSSQWMQSAADVTEAAAVELLVGLLMARGEGASAREAFLAVEATRATGLRNAAWRGRWRKGRIAPEHSEALARLRDQEARRAAGAAPTAWEAAELRARLARIEQEAGVGTDWSYRKVPSVEQLQSSLAPGEAYLSFLAGEEESWGWVLTREEFYCGRLPARARLAEQVAGMRAAVSRDGEGWRGEAALVAREWVGWAGQAAAGARRWLVSADDVMFTFPWAVLDPGRPVGLVPVLSFREPRPEGWERGGLAAFGDAVYNRADPRRGAMKTAAGARAGGGRGGAGLAVWEMPRLAGSGVEVRRVAAVARRVGMEADEHTGPEAGLEGLEAALERRPAVVHVAAHFVEGRPPADAYDLPQAPNSGRRAARPREMFLALSMHADGRPQLLTASGVAGALDATGALVVLSGCGSGMGDHLPGAGLQGFTQAWLAAGARGVVASLWRVADDPGEFFEDFYEALTRGAAADEALAQARTASLQAGAWRARPQAWAGQFSMGKE